MKVTLVIGQDSSTPYLEKGNINLNYQEIVDVLFNQKSSRVCVKRLLRVQENTLFVVDTLNLGDRQDVFYDDLGTWSNRGFRGSVFNILES